MEKNENGYPMTGREGSSAPSRNTTTPDNSAPMPNGNMNGNSTAPRPNGNNGRIRGGDCGESLNCVDSLPLAYVYAPSQRFCMLYSAEDALSHGTLFEALYKPKEVYGRE
jgi:hypothetical protein